MKSSEIFKHEEYDFSPWLAKQNKILADIINEDVSLYKTEMKLGEFYIDIAVANNQRQIIPIENQFKTSDHIHLGKVITYASLLNTDKVIWVADNFRNEHRNLINKMNFDLIMVTFDWELNSKGNYNLRVTCLSKKGMRTYGYNNIQLDAVS